MQTDSSKEIVNKQPLLVYKDAEDEDEDMDLDEDDEDDENDEDEEIREIDIKSKRQKVAEDENLEEGYDSEEEVKEPKWRKHEDDEDVGEDEDEEIDSELYGQESEDIERLA